MRENSPILRGSGSRIDDFKNPIRVIAAVVLGVLMIVIGAVLVRVVVAVLVLAKAPVSNKHYHHRDNCPLIYNL
jgi:xanthine/uracil permease